MLRNEAIAALTHEEIFINRYERLLSWALKLTQHNRTNAEDLLHDAFIQFTLNQPNLNEIENVDGYLRIVLRNVHLSQVRRRAHGREMVVPITEYDSAQIGLRAADQADRVRVQEELQLICRYACVRKETSQAGSVLILRFFHGYYPEEISMISRAPGRAVDKSLWIARSEAKLYLHDPRTLRFMNECPAELPRQSLGVRADADFMMELRKTIFNSRRGDCPSVRDLQNLYRQGEAGSLESRTLGHIVSCPSCLEIVNSLLHLPPLCERYPSDMIGKDTRPKGGSGKGSGGGGGSSSSPVQQSLSQYRRRLREVIEHRPKELHISVNGFILGRQKVGSEVNELSLSINIDERIGFVEVLSEQGIRLLLFNVGPPPDGEVEQRAFVKLNGERTLDLSLRFGSHWPTLRLVYINPSWEREALTQTPALEEATQPQTFAPAQDTLTGTASSETFAHQSRRWLDALKFLLRPGAATAVLSLILVAALLFLQMRAPAPRIMAKDVLRRAIAAEDALDKRIDLVQHRTIKLEEREVGGNTLARRRIEVWQNTGKGVVVRRLYDEGERLVAGDWGRADGSHTLYQHKRQPHTTRDEGLLSLDNVWRFDLSARGFTGLVEDVDKSEIKETKAAYIISYQRAEAGAADGLLKATLTVSKNEFRAVEEALVVRKAEGLREYRLTESGYERQPASGVAPTLFEPDPELLGATMSRTEFKAEATKAGELLPSAPGTKRTTEAIASPELEVEVTYLLDQVKANLGEQLSIVRTREGKLRVEAIVDTEQRKAELLRALAPIINHPAVSVQVETVAEALERRKSQSRSGAGDVIVREIEVTAEPFPAYSELRSYFLSRGSSNEQSDADARQFAHRMLERSRNAMRHIGALKQLARQFSAEDVRRLTPEARAKWLSMIHTHARAFQQETITIRQELKPVFPDLSSGGEVTEGVESGSTAALAQAVERLSALGSQNERALGASFTISNQSNVTPALKTQRFWQSLRSAEKLAERIQHWQ